MVDREVVVVREMRRGRRCLRRIVVGEAREPQQTDRGQLVKAVAADLAEEFKVSTVGFELRTERANMTLGARLAGLLRERG